MLELSQKECGRIGNQQGYDSNNSCIKNRIQTHLEIGPVLRCEVGLVIFQRKLALNVEEGLPDNHDNRCQDKEENPEQVGQEKKIRGCFLHRVPPQ